MLDVPKDVPEETPVDDAGPEDYNDVSIADLGSTEPNILEESEAPGVAISQAGKPEPQGPRVPDFQGMSMRAVVAEAAAMGLPVVVDGSGTARLQIPAPGSVLERGERIRVQFAR